MARPPLRRPPAAAARPKVSRIMDIDSKLGMPLDEIVKIGKARRPSPAAAVPRKNPVMKKPLLVVSKSLSPSRLTQRDSKGNLVIRLSKKDVIPPAIRPIIEKGRDSDRRRDRDRELVRGRESDHRRDHARDLVRAHARDRDRAVGRDRERARGRDHERGSSPPRRHRSRSRQRSPVIKDNFEISIVNDRAMSTQATTATATGTLYAPGRMAMDAYPTSHRYAPLRPPLEPYRPPPVIQSFYNHLNNSGPMLAMPMTETPSLSERFSERRIELRKP